MRSIGKRNIKLVERLTRQAIEKRRLPWGEIENYQGVEAEVREKLPVELWETWECADQEINRVIDDVIFEGGF